MQLLYMMINQLQAWSIDNALLIPYNKELKRVNKEGAFYKTRYGTGTVQIFIHHWSEDLVDESEHYEELWQAADVVICCHPEHLPEWVRVKHPWPDHVGSITGSLTKQYYEVKPS
jgi:hypothetical protein